jgi:threonine-phosphate decarboxylase
MKTEPVLIAESYARPVHGGDVDAIGKMYGLRPEEILDFSANINPAGPPQRVLSRLAEAVTDIRSFAQYPEPDCRSLRIDFAEYAGVEPSNVVVANGTAALIEIALRTAKPKRCLLPVPAFSEYRRALTAAGCEYIPFVLDPAKQFVLDLDAFASVLHEKQCDFCILTNPHNPSGNLIPPASLIRFLKEANDRRINVLLDEAFIDYAIDASLTRQAACLSNVVVLRSVTKFYALAGMRVGFGIANAQLIEALWSQVPAWPVTTLAAIAARESLADVLYAEQTRSSCIDERKFLSEALAKMGIEVWPSVTNFLLLKLPTGSPSVSLSCERLIREHRIVVRNCSSYEGLDADKYMRVAVKDRAANLKLISALKSVLVQEVR